MNNKVDTNFQRRKRRIYNKIQRLLKEYQNGAFLTLTFTDKVLQSTSEKTRERYIKNYLKSQCAFYIANKDYGSKKEREHYHAFIVASTLKYEDINNEELKKIKNQIDFEFYKNHYGRIDHKKIKYLHDYTIEDITNHFFKETAKNSRILQSKGTPTKAEQLERLQRLYEAKNKKASKPMKQYTQEDIIAETQKELAENKKSKLNIEIEKNIEDFINNKKANNKTNLINLFIGR